MAECSLSTGTNSPPYCRAVSVTIAPATTNVSLFASATRFPKRSAASVAGNPAAPTTALMTICASGCVAAATRQSVPTAHPAGTSPSGCTRPTKAGDQAAACSASADTFPLAVSATGANRSRCRDSTRNALVPIDPVDPRIATPRGVDRRPVTLLADFMRQVPATTARSRARTSQEPRRTVNRVGRARRRVRERAYHCPSRRLHV